MSDLMKRLEAAAAGHIAVNGAESHNIFAEALAELRRLKTIEVKVEQLYRPVEVGQFTTAESAKFRLRVGRELGVAIGAFKGSAS